MKPLLICLHLFGLVLSSSPSLSIALRQPLNPQAAIASSNVPPYRQRVIHIVKIKRPDGVVEEKIFYGPKATVRLRK